jgi:signal transduction histidine kinase
VGEWFVLIPLNARTGRLLRPPGLLASTRGAGTPAARMLAPLTQLWPCPRNPLVDEEASIDETRREIDELRASRARLAATANEERRRIERDLHDGVQQHLVALAVNLQLARELADSDPAALKTMLEEIGQDVRVALESTRALAYSVYPPLLLDRGLAEALRGAAAGGAVPTRVEAEATERYPPDVEAAAYFACLEALAAAAERTNPTKQATVRLWAEQGALFFDVVVEGSDWTPSETRLANMNDRLGAAGGRLNVRAAPGRTHLSGTIPLAG